MTFDDFSRRLPALAAIFAFLFIAWTCAHASETIDFRASYCAGKALIAGADPYRAEPLRSCEEQGALFPREIVLPAPFPGYDLAAFSLLARLPYAQASFLWQLILWSCTLVTILALRRLTDLPGSVVTAALLFSDGLTSSLLGALSPIAIASVSLAAYFCSRKRYARATACALGAMCEPHVGLGALLALVLFIPRSRPFAALGLCLLGALTYAATGVTRTLAYAREVLPRHAHAEITHQLQYSLTHVLHLIGVSDHIALAIGSLSYIAMLAAGLIVAGRLRGIVGDDAVLVTVPVAFTLLGGTFVHLQQIAAALPAALLLYAKLPQYRRALGFAILLLAVPWSAILELQGVLPLPALAMILLAWNLLGDARIGVAAAIAQFATLVAAGFLYRRYPTPMHAPIACIAACASPTAFAEEAWRADVLAAYSTHAYFFAALAVPTWCGLLLIVWAASRAARRNAVMGL